MDTVTYPDPRIDALLRERFTGFKLNLAEKNPDFREAAGGSPVTWAPTFRFTDAKGREVRRTLGWLGPADFAAELHLALGHGHLARGRFDDARTVFEEVAGGESRLAAEGGYLAGVAVFLGGKRDMAALKKRWDRLRAEHPGHDWAERASVIEDWKG